MSEWQPSATDVSDAREELIEELEQWQRAYPLSMFPEPDLKKAAEVLKANGMTLDSISASNMRHVVARIVPRVLAELRDLWQPIETAPKDGTRFLARWPYCDSESWFETHWDDDESQGDKPGWWAAQWGWLLDGREPTHWMPLPDPPKLS